jgi:predicted transcriptional regulator
MPFKFMIEKFSFHQAWQLEKLCTENPNYSVHFLSDLLENFDKIENHSARRSFTKIFARLLKNKAKLSNEILAIIDNCNKEKIIETCFVYLLDKKTQVSLLMWLVEILLYYSKEEAWIKQELIFFSQDLQINATPAKLQIIKRIKKELL